ncbi:MAG: ABC transporter ATP-binding protein [Coriobacteriales bacterium]|jgi:energy-coupling factor transport system ATP-binding protein|nr:ABC transporter ATP-binding protein [Coriobacteriales bacterium]
MAYAIEFKDVSFSYGALSEQKNAVLSNIHLNVAQGECVCVTGSSGCGKTTLTRLVNGLIPSFYEGTKQGEVFVNGIELEQWEMDELCRAVGSVFQNPRSQFFNLDTTSELAYGCENLGVSRAETLSNVTRAAELLNLQHLLDRDIHDLSGGERQLLALGAACAMGADIFVLDEPTANLDAIATQAVKRTLQALKSQGKTILMVEHRLHWLDGLVDRMVCMSDGRIINDYTVSEFCRLSTDELALMGLRAWTLCDLRVSKHEINACENELQNSDAITVAPFSIQADSLRAKHRKNNEVLKGLSFTVTGGHAIAVVGRNGQGKSTLAHVIAGLMRETYGGISVDARPLSVRDRVGNIYLVLQESGYQLFASSVRKEFTIGMKSVSENDMAEIDDLISRFALVDKSERHPASLSGGEKQRLALAVGIHAGAKLLVLDEPTSGLDYTNMRRCALEIRRLVNSGRCVFVITHDVELVAAACDQVIEVNRGRAHSTYELNERTLPRVLNILAPDYGECAHEQVASHESEKTASHEHEQVVVREDENSASHEREQVVARGQDEVLMRGQDEAVVVSGLQAQRRDVVYAQEQTLNGAVFSRHKKTLNDRTQDIPP